MEHSEEGNTKKQYNFVKTTLDLVPLLQQLQTHLLLNLLPKFYIWKKLFLYVAFSRNFFISFLSKKTAGRFDEDGSFIGQYGTLQRRQQEQLLQQQMQQQELGIKPGGTYV